ncbi:hypothetical protein Gpo141_00007068 [Globisporangium polare]
MSWFAWCLSVLIVALALLYVSPKLRKTAFIWFTYISLTGWYYFRLWEKKRNGGSSARSPTAKAQSKKPASKLQTDSSISNSSTQGSSFGSSSRSMRQEEADIEDVVYFESAEKLQQRELRHGSERSARLSGSSSSGNSGYSDDSLARFQSSSSSAHQQQQHPKSHLGIFRSLRKSHREDDKHRDSEASSVMDPLSRSTVSEPGGTRTRRAYTGRKKPPSWAD